HVGDINAEKLRLGTIDIEIKLRRRRLEQRKSLRYPWRLIGAHHQGHCGGLQRLWTGTATVLDHHPETARIADAGHWRRLPHTEKRILDCGELAGQRAGDGSDPLSAVV